MKRASIQNGVVKRCNCLHLFVMLVLALMGTSMALQVTTGTRTTSLASPLVALQAWSLPHESTFTFRTWYNEYNPTARVTVYNE